MQVSSSTLSGGQQAAGVGRHGPTGADWTARLSTDEGKKFLQVVSEKTGISTADLTTQLEGGADLGQILQSKGVSRADFRAALDAAGIKPPPGGGHHHGPHSAGPPPPSSDSEIKAMVLKTISDKLGISQADLEKDLQSGTPIDTIAKDKGVSTDDLVKAIMQAISTQLGYAADGTQSSTTQSASIQVDTAA